MAAAGDGCALQGPATVCRPRQAHGFSSRLPADVWLGQSRNRCIGAGGRERRVAAWCPNKLALSNKQTVGATEGRRRARPWTSLASCQPRGTTQFLTNMHAFSGRQAGVKFMPHVAANAR